MKLLMISGDRSLAEGKRGAFYYMLEEFRQYWERIDIICPQDTRYKIPPSATWGGQDTNKLQISKHKFQKVFENVYIHPSWKSVIFQSWFILREGRKLNEEHHYDLMTAHEYPPFYNGIGARWLYNKIKVPYVVEYHHIVGYPRAAGLKERFYKFLYRFFVGYVCKKAKLVRVVNEKQSAEFLEKLGVDKDKIKNIGSQYIDTEVFRPMDLEKKYDVVFAGRLVKNKNVKMLIDAIERLFHANENSNKCEFNSNFKCAIIGDGPEMASQKSKVKSQKLEKNIEFLGWLPTVEDVAKVYNQSRIFVMPSLNEGGPRVCLEAMACGVPVVTTRVGVMLDIIRDGENGLFCDWTAEDMASKILEIYETRIDTNGRRMATNYESECYKIKQLGDEARRTAMRFEKKEMIRNLAKMYEEIIH